MSKYMQEEIKEMIQNLFAKTPSDLTKDELTILITYCKSNKINHKCYSDLLSTKKRNKKINAQRQEEIDELEEKLVALEVMAFEVSADENQFKIIDKQIDEIYKKIDKLRR